jgi:hypothetical protein
MPHIIKFCRLEDDELREYCLQAFESFVRRCPKEISPFVSDVGVQFPFQAYEISSLSAAVFFKNRKKYVLVGRKL